jgi:uncharacterized protein YjbI with pentapeptide repeats
MPEPPKLPPWSTCQVDGCRGRLLDGIDRCLAHVSTEDRAVALQRITRGDPLEIGAGVKFAEELLAELLAALPRNDEGRVVLNQADFRDAWLPNLDLAGVAFKGFARFDGAMFGESARFSQARFQTHAWFGGARFQAAAWFDGTRFQGNVGFVGANFQRLAAFRGATFQNEAEFHEVSFQGEAAFDRASFEDDAEFDRARFEADARFPRARFHSIVNFSGASFQGDAWFPRTSFHDASQVGPLLVRKRLVLDDVVFDQRVQIQAAAGAVCLRRARFPAGVQLHLRYATVDLQDTDLAAPAILAGIPAFLGLDENQLARVWQRLPPGPRTRRWRPRLASVERADVAGLRLAEVDLRACRFAGAHNLDRLRVEGVPLLARPPGRWRARRVTIAEEQHWRARRRRSRPSGWYPRACQPPASPGVAEPTALSPVQVAAVYRGLRKGREDAKDEPGAADFYYGEMEMRRHSRATPTGERLLLAAYWLVSGYGLRAWRALAAFGVVIGLVGVGFSRVGFHHPHPALGVSWLYALQATVSLEGKARQLSGQLTLPGELLRVGLRLTGPALLFLALLSIRNRVKR